MEKYSISKIIINLIKSLSPKIMLIKAMIYLKNKKIMKKNNGVTFSKIISTLKIQIKNFKQ
jgi:hypothetical protein